MELTKRAIPFDQPIKITLLFLHFIGFSGWYGGILAGMKTSLFIPCSDRIIRVSFDGTRTL